MGNGHGRVPSSRESMIKVHDGQKNWPIRRGMTLLTTNEIADGLPSPRATNLVVVICGWSLIQIVLISLTFGIVCLIAFYLIGRSKWAPISSIMYHLGEGTRPCPFPIRGNGHGRVTEPQGDQFSGQNLDMFPKMNEKNMWKYVWMNSCILWGIKAVTNS